MFNPLNLFRRKKEGGGDSGSGESSGEEGESEVESDKENKVAPPEAGGGGTKEMVRLSTDLDRVKASVESFGEVRKSLMERLSGLNEQIGELRAMIMDRDRAIQEIELKAVKAADLVESVKPEKLMIEIQKEDAKFEALKASFEGNEAIMHRIMDELKEARRKLEFFRGVEEIIKLSEEVKRELVEIKKVEANIQVNADKVETIYSELRKKFQSIDMFEDKLQEFKVTQEQNTKDIDLLKTKLSNTAEKSELDKVSQKVDKYIGALKEINKSSSLTKDVEKLRKILESLK